MDGDFNESFFANWCELYVRFVVNNRQQFSSIICNCRSDKLQSYLFPTAINIPKFLEKTTTTDDDILTIFGYLKFLDDRMWQKPHQHLLEGFIETIINDNRYILTRVTEHPIFKAVSEENRFKLDRDIGTKGVLQFRHHWQNVDHSTELELRRSTAFDSLTQKNGNKLKIGLSPFACKDDMIWTHDSEDPRGNDGRIPFWCSGARDEAELLARILSVLAVALKQEVDILLFPELVLTETLQRKISDWLFKNNALNSIIRLVIAGSCHVIEPSGHNAFYNRCTVLNFMGDSEWVQDKRQPFMLNPEEAEANLGVHFLAYEPTRLSQRLVMRHTALGTLATPICLDFLCDEQWKTMPVDVFFVPVMSPSLSRFTDNCRNSGNMRGAAAFICNAQTDEKSSRVFYYVPSRASSKKLEQNQDTPFLFTIEIDIDMNYT
jgi:hypothetical protein